MFGRLLLPLFLLWLLTVPVFAQTQDTGSGTSTTAKPATPPADTSASASSEKKKAKKVWTNEEIGSLHGAISVVGDPRSSSTDEDRKKAEPAAKTATDDARQRQIENYRNQIAQIRTQIDSIDDRIAELKNFKAENTAPSGGINPNQGYNMVPTEDQVKQLTEKKKQLESKIGDIEVEARKNGIDPGDLR